MAGGWIGGPIGLAFFSASFVAGFLVVLLLTPWVRRFAARSGAMDREVRKRTNGRVIPRLGGVAIAAGFYGACTLLALTVDPEALASESTRLLTMLACGISMVVLGVFDDLASASPIQKLAVQIPVGIITWWAGIRVPLPIDAEVLSISEPLSFLLTTGWLVLIMNAVNLLDGLDGLASGIALQVLLGVALHAWHVDQPAFLMTVLALAGSVAGFLLYNHHPAKIFMGDSGSLFLGYLLGAGSIWFSSKGAAPRDIAWPLLLLGVPLLDTAIAIFRRTARGRSVFAGDVDHIFHRFLETKASHRAAVHKVYLVGAIFGALAALVLYVPHHAIGILVLTALFEGGALLFGLGYLRRAELRSASRERRRNRLFQRARRSLTSAPESPVAIERFTESFAELAGSEDARRIAHEIVEANRSYSSDRCAAREQPAIEPRRIAV